MRSRFRNNPGGRGEEGGSDEQDMGENGAGCEERDENSEGGGIVGGYKNPRAAYCLRRAMVRRREGMEDENSGAVGAGELG